MDSAFYDSGDIYVEYGGTRVHHRLPGPFHVERFKTGAAIVLNANGINWIHVCAGHGQTMFWGDDAEKICAALNDAARSQPQGDAKP